MSGDDEHKQFESLKKAMQKNGDLECSRIVDVPSGRENHAYGGECVITRKNGNKDHAMVCDALMTNANGYRYLGDRKISAKSLGFFTGSKCAGG